MSDFEKASFSHETAEAAAAREGYIDGQHYAVVGAIERKYSKEKPEVPGVQYKMLKATLVPLSDTEDFDSGVGRGIDVYQCLPFWDPKWDSLDYMVKDRRRGEVHIQEKLRSNLRIFAQGTRDFLSALAPDDVPPRPRKNEEGELVFNGEVVGSSEFQACNEQSLAAAGDMAEQLWNDGPEGLKDAACFILVENKLNGDFVRPDIVRYSDEQMTDSDGEVIPVEDKQIGAVTI